MIELHRLMLRDTARNQAYSEAIARAVRPGDVVVDLGAGSGFLAMLSAKAGARKVYAIEASDMAEIGRQLTRDNQLHRIIEWIHAPSTEVRLKEKAQVLVTETFGSHPFEENAHEFVRDARKRFLAPHGVTLPSHVEVFVAPAAFASLRDDWDLFARPVGGLDFQRLRPYTLEAMYAERGAPEMLLGPAALLERVALGDATPSRRERAFALEITRAGALCGLMQWFCLTLTDGVTLSTAPDAPPTHWRQIFLPLPEAQPVQPGDYVEGVIRLDTRLEVGVRLSFSITVRRR